MVFFRKEIKKFFGSFFSDDSSTECCNEHLWLTQTVNERRLTTPKFSVRSLAEIQDTIKVRNNTRVNHYVPMVKPVEFVKSELPIHPYLLGVLLGNGTLGDKFVHLATSDSFIVEKHKVFYLLIVD